MDTPNLKKHLRALAALSETESPIISCYLNLEQGEAGFREPLSDRIRLLRRALSADERGALEEALGRVESFIAAGLSAEARGAAVYARAGSSSFFLGLQFRVPLPTRVTVDRRPSIYDLVKLRGTYRPYVVMLSSTERVRILEVELGEATDRAVEKRPDVRERGGRGWAREHYRSHRQHHTHRFLKEQIGVLDRLLARSDHSRLVLAGNHATTARVRALLPKRLIEKVIDTVDLAADEPADGVVTQTLSSLLEWEQHESLGVVERLRQGIFLSGLAATGTSDCLTALRNGQAEVLLLSSDYAGSSAWTCGSCQIVDLAARIPAICGACGQKDAREADTKEELVRLAEKTGCQVEIVEDRKALGPFGGVGCLLRYLSPEQYGA